MINQKLTKLTITLFIIFLSVKAYSSEVITCDDLLKGISDEAKITLHKDAQKRAQRDIEDYLGKKLIHPYGVSVKSIEGMAGFIEIYWCSPSQPLHDAWYSFYSRNKAVFRTPTTSMLLDGSIKKGVCELE